MKCRYIYMFSLFFLISFLCCGCSSDSEEAIKTASVIVFIVLFLGTSLFSAKLTYRMRRKNYKSDKDFNREKE